MLGCLYKKFAEQKDKSQTFPLLPKLLSLIMYIQKDDQQLFLEPTHQQTIIQLYEQAWTRSSDLTFERILQLKFEFSKLEKLKLQQELLLLTETLNYLNISQKQLSSSKKRQSLVQKDESLVLFTRITKEFDSLVTKVMQT